MSLGSKAVLTGMAAAVVVEIDLVIDLPVCWLLGMMLEKARKVRDIRKEKGEGN